MITKMKQKDYTKVAKFILSIGINYSKDIFKFLEDEEVKEVIKEIVKIKEITQEEKRNIIKEFINEFIQSTQKSFGGYNVAKELLLKIYEPKKVEEIISYLNLKEGPFSFLEEVETNKIVEILKNERPQIIAVVLSFLSTEKGVEILNELNKDLNVEVVRRMGIVEKKSPDNELIEIIKNILKENLKTYTELKINSLEKLINILQQIDKAKQKEIIDLLEKDEPKLATIIKKQLFRFEDLKNLEDKYIQRILREIESKDLVIALKGVSEELKQKIFKNMSERGAEMIKEDLEIIGPLKRSVVEEAQQKILNIVRKLEASGEIIMEGSSSDVIV